ncbi:MAG TPA: hypothetical protein G4O15_01885 [Dehalococcoidia bacterium]|nr:hypothetical protein [Dehalococcoidia bacterium]
MGKKLLTSFVIAVVFLLSAISPALANDTVIPVVIDIKPGSDPNPFNVKSKGKIAVALLGTAELDVMTVDPESLVLVNPEYAFPAGPSVSPLRCSLEDSNEDGILDIVVLYNKEDLRPLTVTKVPHGYEMAIGMRGNLKAEYTRDPIYGEDIIVVLNKMYDEEE